MTTAQASAGPPDRPLSPALDKTFKIGLVLKGLDGILEVVGGLLLLSLSPQAIEHIARTLTALTVFDAVLVGLTWREYRSKKAALRHPKPPPGRRP